MSHAYSAGDERMIGRLTVQIEVTKCEVVQTKHILDQKKWVVHAIIKNGNAEEMKKHGLKLSEAVALRVHSPVMTFGFQEKELPKRNFLLTYLEQPSRVYSGDFAIKEAGVRQENDKLPSPK